MRRAFLTLCFVLCIFFFCAKSISIIIPEDKRILQPKAQEVVIKSKAELGKKLFFDPILSKDSTVSCASCHKPEHGFGDDKAVSLGINGQKGDRNTPTIFNTSHLKFLFWDGRANSLEEQALGPITNPKEMGETLKGVLTKLNNDPEYVKEFADTFKQTPITTSHLLRAIAAFERTLISEDSDYDRFINGDEKVLSASAKRGFVLFNGKANCNKCHSGPDFADSEFHNIGLPITSDVGRAKISLTTKDTRKFKTPTLREVANTAPYLHDGMFKTLQEVITFYNTGGSSDTYKDPEMKPLNLTQQEQKDLVEFLKALSGRQAKIEPPSKL